MGTGENDPREKGVIKIGNVILSIKVRRVKAQRKFTRNTKIL